MFSKLHNLYWFIRMTRGSSKKRRYYRHVDQEEVRLLCRQFI